MRLSQTDYLHIFFFSFKGTSINSNTRAVDYSNKHQTPVRKCQKTGAGESTSKEVLQQVDEEEDLHSSQGV